MVNYFNDYLNGLFPHISRFLKGYAGLSVRHFKNKLHLFKILVWLNIFFQVTFPLSIAFSPAIAAAINQHTITATEPYILGPGETPSTIAQKYHISLDELKKFNQFRKFSKPFEQLTLGDELDIPLQVADFSPRNSAPKAPTPDSSGFLGAQSAQQNNYGGQFLTGTDTLGARAPQDKGGSEAGGMVRSTATSEAGQTLQQWLGQFGTARVQLNVDDDFHLDGSALDLLIPLYDQPHEMFFTQLGARNKDSRNTINIGSGARTWQGDWMLGMNAFFDYDLTGENRRLGLGLEAWRDYLKLSANSYIRTSDWQSSRDFDDYLERPANGYDLRAEAYLPAYPQLGGELVFEQYRGNNVALFGKDNLQKDPYALTLGLNYTPISLLTFGVNHRQGKSDMNDTSFNLQLNYRMGASWQSQLDPDSVAATRTLAGSRYDLVDRNNNIVLQYQKQQVIELRLPEYLSGFEGEQVTVVAQVNSKYALERIDWDYSAISAAGGTVTQTGNNTLVVRLPAYQRTADATNLFNLSAVAYDIKRNASNRATSTLEVLPAQAQITAANLTVTRNNALANGIDANTVRAVVTDTGNNPVSGQKVEFTAGNGAHITTVIAVTGTDGVATASLTNTLAGTAPVTATLNGISRSVDTAFVADSSTAHIAEGNLTVTKNNSPADGASTNEVRALVTDTNGNPLAGQTVTFTATNGAHVVTASIVTDANGVALGHLTNTLSGVSTVTATLSNSSNRAVDTTFIADGSTARIAEGDLTVTQNNALANGSAVNQVRARVTDENGNPLAGQTVTFTATNGAHIVTASVTTDANGVALGNLTNTLSGVSTVTATLGNGSNRTVDTAFIADPGTAQITAANLTVTQNNALANGVAANQVRALVTDAHGNPLANQTVTYSASNGAHMLDSNVATDADGVSLASLTNTTVGVSAVTASLGNGGSRAVDTLFVADNSTAQIAEGNLTVTQNNALANGSAANQVRAVVTDAHGNPLAGQAVTFTATNGAHVVTASVVTDVNGVALADLTNTTSGVSVVTATLGNNSNRAVNTTFIPDAGTAQILEGNLTVTANNALANGNATNQVRALVTDANGNPLANQIVAFTASNGAHVVTGSVTTDANGVALGNLTNTLSGVSAVTATLGNSSNRTVDTTFIADSGTAQIAAGNLTVTVNNALANGSDANQVRAVITDAHGNPLANQTVTFTASNGAHVLIASVTTDANGVALANLTNTASGISTVTATLSNSSNRTVDTVFIPDSNTARILEGNLTVTADNALANGVAANQVRALVTDENGNPLANQIVTFTAGNGATVQNVSVTTDANGVAVSSLTNTLSGVSAVTATLSNNSNRSVNTTFIADSSTAQIAEGDLTVIVNNSPANGSTANQVRALVTDAHGNLLANQTVTFTAGNGATVQNVSVATDANGVAVSNLTNTTSGISTVTATLANNSNRSVDTLFVADNSTAQIAEGDLTVTVNNSPANGSAANQVRALVTDAHGNPLANQTVTFTATNGATVQNVSVATDASGVAVSNLTNTASGISTVTATLANNSNRSVDTTFIADSSTAQIAEGNLTVIVNNALANGSAANQVRAVVTDAHGNLLANQTVTFTAANGATVQNVTVATDASGVAISSLTNTLSGVSAVTATLGNGNNRAVDTTFIADSSTAQIAEGNLTVTVNDSPANGTDANQVRALVTDAHGNLLANQTVTFTATNGAQVETASVVTDANGVALANLTNTTSGVSVVTATLSNSSNRSANTTFIADSSTAQILDGNLTVTVNNAPANGTAANQVRAVVTDAQGNPLAGQTVTFTASNGATVQNVSVVTDADGVAISSLTNTTGGTSVVTATLANNANRTVDVLFGANAFIGTITLLEDNATADGRETNIIRVNTVDSTGQPAANITVTITSANPDGTFHVVTAGAETNAQGYVDIAYNYTLAKMLNLMVTLPETGQTEATSGGVFTIPNVKITVTSPGLSNDPTFPATANLTLISARGQPLPSTLLDVRVSQVALGGQALLPFPAATAVSPITTNNQGQASLSATSTASGSNLTFVLSAPGINEGQGETNDIFDSTALFDFF